jgi:molecular chaperone HtpG
MTLTTLNLSGARLENKAVLATDYASLGSFSLKGARSTLTHLLNSIGQTKQFSTYTKHDISHIDALLLATDWLLPDATFEKLTVADALVLTLAMYVHDIGMLVTKNEYDRRHESEFPSFKQGILDDTSSRGFDFRARLDALNDEDREDLLYEEFVRTYHAERVNLWVSGKDYARLGVADEAVALVREVLAPLPDIVRKDIGLVAKSHHSSDLDDLERYKVTRTYGPGPEESVNIHYACIMLRTADLLHITQDRTPSVQFRLNAPVDPMGQVEWKKQAAVRAVSPSLSQPGTIVVHATFGESDGYFGLQQYLKYAQEEIKQSRDWVEKAREAQPVYYKVDFPWHEIDDREIESEGFEPRHFHFELDQERVLDLLTGHTLYNDPSVAVRELLQNAVDTVRVRQHNGGAETTDRPDVLVEYDSKSMRLKITDQGLGMSQATIENHFLRVGSSGYRTKEFESLYPSFNPISRFGIGVLSAFMIADEVSVVTRARSESVGRQLILKSVHGSYLIKHLSPGDGELAAIPEGGTSISLSLRPSNKLTKTIQQLAEYWFVLPGCHIAVIEDGVKSEVGESTVEAALASSLAKGKLAGLTTRVKSYDFPGMAVAMAEVWNEYYKEWEFLRVQDDDLDEGEKGNEPQGVCAQGIRVSDTVPGLRRLGPVMLVNLVGKTAPKTNVARSDLESGEALSVAIRHVYEVLREALVSQVPAISSNVSTRFALREVAQLYSSAFKTEQLHGATHREVLEEVFRDAALHAVEVDGNLTPATSRELEATGLWTLSGPAADDAARFLEWVPKESGLLKLLQDGGLMADLPQNEVPLLADHAGLFAYDKHLWRRFEPTEIWTTAGGTSLYTGFSPRAGRWEDEHAARSRFSRDFRDAQGAISHPSANLGFSFSSNLYNVFPVDESIQVKGLDDVEAVQIGNYRIFLPESKFATCYKEIAVRIKDGDSQAGRELATLISVADMVGSNVRTSSLTAYKESLSAWLARKDHAEWPALDALIELNAEASSTRIWSSSSVWQKRRDAID